MYSPLLYYIFMIFLETERVILRNFTEDDLDDIFLYASVPDVGEMAGWNHHENIEESRTVLYKVFLPNPEDYAIVDKKTNHVIGSFGLHQTSQLTADFPPETSKEIGYVLAKNFWGKGIMSEILSSIIQKWKEEGKIDVLTATTFSTNKASAHVLEKCGFRHYRIIKDEYVSSLDKVFDKYCFYLRLKQHD